MTVGDLRELLNDLPADMPVDVIFDGKIDSDPCYNVDDNTLYIEGVSNED